MSYDTVLPFDLPSVGRKKVSVAFDGGRLSSDAGVLLLRVAERKLGLASRLAGCLRDKRDPDLIEHTLEEMLRLRMFAIAAGYEDADDCDALRHDPVFKMAVGRLPESGQPLCSQPTMSRLENAPSKIELARLMAAMVDLFCESYRRPPASIVLDIDDTCDTVHGHQQLSLFNAYYDERCFLPIHIYEGNSGKPVAMILRSGKTPSGVEVRCVLKHVVKRIRRHWPRTHIVVRGDSHYGRVEAMAWCEKTPGVDYVLGFASNAVLKALTDRQAQALTCARSRSGDDKLRRFMSFDYAAKGWDRPRRFVARIEATANGVDVRYVVSSLELDAKQLYETTYCARGTSENFIKWHKSQLASDRTSCRKPEANQFRLILHTAAYWLLLAIRQAAPKRSALASAEFATLRLHLIKIAARVIEGLARIRIHLPSACPNAAVLRAIAGRLCAAGP
ncbi:MAG: IS1380 family transposase [Methyloceanibacter sp.]|uniref:IS1380 family transposase n=1 Tax=Methyloceanibacter sp. TaxID=1965321 RepID=UPI003EE2C9EC